MLLPSYHFGVRAVSSEVLSSDLRAFAALAPLVPRRYRIVSAEHIARTLLASTLAATSGTHVIESEAI